MESKKKPKQMPWVQPAACEGCGDCVTNCKKGGLIMTETNIPGVFVPWMKNPEECVGCGKCASVCTWGAISMTAYVDQAAERFLTKQPYIYSD